ncbi:hypothetical protein [Novosphingobium sp.]|uniref:hypothetical protein n=1 Tax=Novosphingobium sp. TaxID=1874826 RepID=UPI003BAB29B2
MHTVRNRLASRPPVAKPIAAGSKAPNLAATRHELAYLQRGSMAVPLVIPDESGLIEERPQKRRNPKGKKARKAAARMAAVREARALEPVPCEVTEPPRSVKPAAKKGGARPKAQRKTTRRKAAGPQQLPSIPAASLVSGTYSPPVRVIAERPVPALALPVRFEPSVETPVPLLLLPPKPEPLVELPAAPAEPEPATALAVAPLPRARALVPVRRQGLVDVIAFLLRDSGRRLARWSARRHQTRAEQAALRQAEAQQINLQRELEALDALRRAKV